MSQKPYPNLHQQLIDSLPKQPKGKQKKEDSSPLDNLFEDLSNFGPILNLARTKENEYQVTLKNDLKIDFTRCDWSSSDDNFITFYRSTAKGWEVTDVCIDDISYLSLTLSN